MVKEINVWKVVFSRGKVRKGPYFKILSWADFDLLESNSIYILCTKINKFTMEHFFFLMHILHPCECPYSCWPLVFRGSIPGKYVIENFLNS